MSISHHHRGGGKLGPSCGDDDRHLQLDQACLQFSIGPEVSATGLNFQAQSKECYQCSYWLISDNVKNGTFLPVNTTYQTNWRLSWSNGSQVCAMDNFQFGQYGTYLLDVKNSTNCDLRVLKEPSNPYLPILWAALALVALQAAWKIGQNVYRSGKVQRILMRRGLMAELLLDSGESETAHDDRSRGKRRVRSLDAFRGLAIVIMIFVNYGGGGYYFFAHAKWNGLTVADLVFPWFMWIMGVSMVISIQSQLRNSKSRLQIGLNVGRRAATLFFLGLVINSIGAGHNDLRSLRIPGVLQRFGITYLIVGLLQAAFAQRELPSLNQDHLDQNTIPWWWQIRDIKACFCQWIVMLAVAAFHACLTFLLPIPGCPSGYLGPGGLHMHGNFSNCTGGAARYIDVSLFGENHIYKNPSAKYIYDTKESYDPEGFLGSLTAAFLVFLGVQCGYTLLLFSDWVPRIKRWLIWALILGTLAGGLCGFSKEDGAIPINKNLWSLSFTLALAAMAFFLLCIMYILVDVLGAWSGAPLYYAGMNPILLYVGHEICEDFFPFSWQPFTQTHAELLAMNLWGVSLWVLVAYFLFKRKMFLSI